MDDEKQKPIHLRSIIKRNKNGDITSISVKQAERPRFNTPAYDEIVLGGKIPRHLRRQAD